MIKGQCDYVPWSVAVDNLDALPAAKLTYLHDAGHATYADRPDAVRAAVGGFLRGLTTSGVRIPGVLVDPDVPPADYQPRR